MTISKEAAREWAKTLMKEHCEEPEFCLVYEDEILTEDWPDAEDQRAIYDEMRSAKIEVSWDD